MTRLFAVACSLLCVMAMPAVAAPLVWGSGSWGEPWQAPVTSPSDLDGDGFVNASDAFPSDIGEWLDTDGDSIGDNADIDDDNDGVNDIVDNCAIDSNFDQADVDLDGAGDVCDLSPNGDDGDADGISDVLDNCLTISNASQTDTDLDGLGDDCDSFSADDTQAGDTDTDTVDALIDNCPWASNADQADGDSDGTGDVCDATPNGDADRDGIDDQTDNAPEIFNPPQDDTDGDGIGDINDVDPLDASILGAAQGITKKSLFGAALTFIDDINDDGFPEYAVAAAYSSPVKPLKNAGVVFVYSGLSGSVLYTLSGQHAGDRFGAALAAVSDLDADGYRDLIIGIPLADTFDPVTNKVTIKNHGRVEVYSGKTGVLLFGANGESADDNFGIAVAGSADVNGDGKPDILVGASKFNVVVPITLAVLKDAGRIYVLSGVDGAEIHAWDGSASGEFLGSSVTSLGDINNDTISDIVAGAFGADPVNAGNIMKDAGRLYAFSGDGATTPLWTVDGLAAGDALGFAIAATDDVNGDLVGDVAASAYRADIMGITKLMKDAGAVSIYSGVDGAVIQNSAGTQAGQHYGFCLASAADVNNDAAVDLIIGSPRFDVLNGSTGKLMKDAGAVYLLTATDTGTAAAWQTLEGIYAGDQYGAAIALIRLNADLFADLLVGAPLRNGALSKDTGSIEILSGSEF